MVAPSKNYTLIGDASIDADSPLDVTLMTQIRDNLIHLEEWLGDGYTAAKNHYHDGSDSKPIETMGFSVGSKVGASADTERQSSSTTYTKQKEIAVSRSGGIRVSFDLKKDGATTAYGRVYKNGVAIGVERTDTTGAYVNFSEDFTGILVNDLIQLYTKGAGGLATHSIRNFRISTLNYSIDTVLLD